MKVSRLLRFHAPLVAAVFVLLLSSVPRHQTDALFTIIEIDWLNDTVYLSPVQVMFLGLFMMFVSILAFYQWAPIQVTPMQQIGRMLVAAESGLGTASPWEMGKALITMDPSSCVKELLCEFDEATNRFRILNQRVQSKKRSSEGKLVVPGSDVTCGAKFERCPFSFHGIVQKIVGNKST